MATKKKTVNFEQSLEQLEELVLQMEKGDLTLEQSLQAFETGISLTRTCQSQLQQAEQKVELLTEQQGKLQTRPFHEEDLD